MNTQPIILRHRPQTFEQITGHQEAIAPLQRVLESNGRPHAYLLTGPSGVGKTTIARIIARQFNSEVIEVDAASNNGVDAMRLLIDLGHYMAPGAQTRLIILDECHMLSRNAWNALLKVLEEPPEHLYLALCTTEFFKIPNTILGRCYHVPLKSLDDQIICDYLLDIAGKEKWEIVNDDVFALIVRESDGSPRRALSLFEVAHDAPSLAEAKRIVAIQGSDAPMTQVLRILIGGQGKWAAIQPMLAQLSDDDFTEGSLINATRYIIGTMNKLAPENEAQAKRLWTLIAAFVYPAHSYDPRSIFYAAVGRILWE
jgi:DNA polymerase III gamma/tau subunit